MTPHHTQHASASAAEPGIAPERIAELLQRLRETRPLVQCLTNTVVAGFTANALLALGASPAMTDIAGEAGPFAEAADGLLINLGTPKEEQRRAMREAAEARTAMGAAWVLDPVAVGALPVRTQLARELLAHGPSVIRGNPSEIIALSGGAGGRGTDSTDDPEAAVEPARRLLAGRSGVAGEAQGEDTGRPVGAAAISGPTDLIVGSGATLAVPHGHELLTRVTGGGCALGAVIAAFTAVTEDPGEAAVLGSLVWGLAAEDAAQRCAGPGTFAVHLLDALSALSPEDAARRSRVSPESREGAA
ncbi:hydroxyethylthiazole kinase [Kocuria palustris]|uniref:hydroxyethylthiazole kinase n=1 Tax=Kocuria palustris TaxID=71999 RepID=UPI0011A9AF46|nr:hydroxyethylthiazole kinase [Kocuria palustris]